MVQKNRHIALGSKMDNIHAVERFVEEICDEYNIYNSYFGNITVSVTEAFYNAMIHGNGGDVSKKVDLHFESNQAGLIFTIKDQGMGFDFRNIKDPTDISIENYLEIGKGLFLIRSLADEVNFHDKGSTIEIIFKISSINKEITAKRLKQMQEYSKVGQQKSVQR